MYRLSTMVVLLALGGMSLTALSQGYLYVPVNETAAYMADMDNNLEATISAPMDEQLSDWRSLPFGFSYFGQPVNGYYVSDNGYITFDQSATASISENSALPSAEAPLNAIFAYWDALQLAEGGAAMSNEIRIATIGTEPDRVHVVEWRAVTPDGIPPSSLKTLSFAIGIHEDGSFDIAFVDGRVLSGGSGSIGAQNSDASQAAFVGGPDLDFPKGGNLTYQFINSDIDFDAEFTTLDLPAKVVLDKPMELQGTIRNLGNNTINSIEVSMQVADGPVETQTVQDINLTSNQSWDLQGINWTPTVGGKYLDLRVWISAINGDSELDAIGANNAQEATFFGFLNVSADRHFLVEEFTGTWCGWCGAGAVLVQEMIDEFPNVLAVGLHGGRSSEPMAVSASVELISEYRPSFPMAMFDRAPVNGDILFTMDGWMNAIASRRSNDYTPFDLDIERSWNSETRTMSIRVTVNYVDYPEPDEYRLNLFILEDNVSSEDPAYDQVNYISGRSGWEDHPLYDAPRRIAGFVHNHVLRDAPTGTWGVELDRQLFQAGSSESQQFDVVLPEDHDETQIKLLAFVHKHDSRSERREVAGATEKHLIASSVDVADEINTEVVGFVSPNPARMIASLPVQMPANDRLKVELYNSLGAKVLTLRDYHAAAGLHNVPIDTRQLADGNYLLRVQAGDQMHWRTLLVAR